MTAMWLMCMCQSFIDKAYDEIETLDHSKEQLEQSETNHVQMYKDSVQVPHLPALGLSRDMPAL